MSKRILALISVLALVLTLLPQTLVKAEINQAAVDYLKLQTPDPWITMALAAAGEGGLDLTHLETVDGTLATDYEKAILALVAVGEDPTIFGVIDFVDKLKMDFYSDSQIGDSSLLNDDIWGILALSAAGESPSSQIMQDAKNVLLTNQNQDGGWGYNVGGDSDTNDTASAIMALLEVDMTAADQEILEAIEYLKNQQNSDGGFPYVSGSESDSGSDSWVISAIYKLNQDPTSADWQNNNNNAVDHLKTLQKGDGSFKWVASEDTGYITMTAFAVIALAEKYYPIIGQPSSPELHHLRIEGQTETICDIEIEATTALDIVEAGAEVCQYTYEIQDTGFGPYLFRINDEEAQGMSGWMYFVNYISPMVGAADYVLGEDDEVLWYYGDWGWPPTRVSADDTQVDVGDQINIIAEYFDGSDWQVLSQATIMVGQDSHTVLADGSLTLSMDTQGSYDIYVEMTGYVRSAKAQVIVGSISEESVGLMVEIDQGGGGPGPGPDIVFEVSVADLDFGKLGPGEEDEKDLILTNNSTSAIYVEAQVAGDAVFSNNLKLNDSNWQDYYTTLSVISSEEVDVKLIIPSNYTGSGVKTGDLTFWAIQID